MDSTNPDPRVPDEYQLKENLSTKAIRIRYLCPNCETGIMSKLSDAGTEDRCPQCGLMFIVPAKDVLKKHPTKSAEREKQRELDQQNKQEQRRQKKEQQWERRFPVSCAACGKGYSVPETRLGQSTTCTNCGKSFKIEISEGKADVCDVSDLEKIIATTGDLKQSYDVIGPFFSKFPTRVSLVVNSES